MRPEQYEQSDSGRLVRSRQDTVDYWAFVPNPLPPKLELDATLIRALSEADRGLGMLAGLGRTMLNPQLLIKPFVCREAILSSLLSSSAFSYLHPGHILAII